MASPVNPRPSGAGRWASYNGCPGSALLEAKFPEVKSDPALEGDAAHMLFERFVKHDIDPFTSIDTQASNGVFITTEMASCVVEFNNHLKDIVTWGEWHCEEYVAIPRVDLDHGGTPDLWHYSVCNKVLTVPDLKFGYGIVEVVENWQLMDYALGIIDQLPSVEFIQLVIYQPRVAHPQGLFRTWLISRAELEAYLPQFQKAYAETQLTEPPIKTGPHCTNCAALCRCPVARQAALNAIEVSGFGVLDEYDGATLAAEKELLNAAMRAIKTRKEAIDNLVESEIKSGTIVPGFMLRESTGHPAWNKGYGLDDVKALSKLTGKKLTTEKPMTPTQAVGAGVSKGIINRFSHRPSTGLKVVRANSEQEAERIFGK